MTAKTNQKKVQILEILKAQYNGQSDSEIKLLKRIINTALKLETTKNLTADEIAAKSWDVKAKYVEFFNNITLDPIYTVSGDREFRERIDAVAGFLDTRQDGPLVKHTINFSDNRSETVGNAIHQDPNILDVARYLTGLGDITLELLASGWLHHEKFYAGLIKKHSMRDIKQTAGNDIRAAKSLARHLIDLGLSPKLDMVAKLDDNDRAELVDTLAHYQSRGHIAKLSGHKAEMIAAHHLNEKGISFQPREKLDTLGTADIKIPQITGNRLFDIVIPDVRRPKIVIEAAYYNSNTGSVASKAVREMEGTKRAIQENTDHTVRNIKLIGFLDGAGWIAMTGHLIKMLLILDDFVQLNTIGKVKRYL